MLRLSRPCGLRGGMRPGRPRRGGAVVGLGRFGAVFAGILIATALSCTAGPVAAQTTRGVTVSQSEIELIEQRSRNFSGTYTVRLNSQPTADVTVTPASDHRLFTFDPAMLTFTRSNWETEQSVTVTARQDVKPGGSATISHTVEGGDYESVAAESVFAIVVGRLVSNLVTNILVQRYRFSSYDLAQGFTTGRNGTGYKLKNVQLTLIRPTATDAFPTVKIFSGSATGTEEVTLTTPITTQTGDSVQITFPAPENSKLNMSTHYWVVAEADSGDSGWYNTVTNHNNQLAMGWSLDNQGQFRTATSTGSFSILDPNRNHNFQIAIDGAPLPPLPEITIAADTSPVTEGTAAAFTLTRTGSDTAALTVDVTVSESEDMIEETNEGATTVTFQAGSATATLSVTSEDDKVDEDNSVVTATLVADTASPAKYEVGTVSSATVTVEDNDTADMMTAPTVKSITRQTPASSPTNANSLTWRVTFSEDVANVDATDFEVSGTTATPTAASGGDGIDGLRRDGQRGQPGGPQRHGDARVRRGPEHRRYGRQRAFEHRADGGERQRLCRGQRKADGDDRGGSDDEYGRLHGDDHLPGGGERVRGG